MSDPFVIAGRAFHSRLIVGTGKYPSHQVMRAAHEASGADMVTVAVRRVDITRRTESLLDYIDTSRIALLPNTAGCYSADDAVRTARLGREAGLSNWVKLEVIGDERTLFPDVVGTIEAARVLVKEGFAWPACLFGFAWAGPGGCGVVKKAVFPVRPFTAGFVFGAQTLVKPPPVPWQPVAHFETMSTQLALRRNGDVVCVGTPAQPLQLTRPVSTTVNRTTKRPCIWS